MTTVALKKKLRGLPIGQRVDLMEDLVLSIARDQKDLPLLAWQKQILDERLEQDEANPADRISAAEFSGRLDAFKSKAARKNRRNDAK